MFNFFIKSIDFLGGVQVVWMMAAELEGILGRLLYPDSEIIRQVEDATNYQRSVCDLVIVSCGQVVYVSLVQATAELQAVYKDPGVVGALCEVLRQSQSPQVRESRLNKL